MSKHLTRERLRELLDYDPLTGLFVWKKTRGGSAKAGSIAGGQEVKGYVVITVDGDTYKAHRLAFLWMEGRWPKEQVDHANMIRSDNRWSNLRPASQTENLGNTIKQKNNTSGAKGVTWSKSLGKWRVRVGFGGIRFHVGYFSTVEEANACYNGAASLAFGVFHREN